MARVFPGQDFEDVYNARNIYTTNIQGDDYKVRRSANDSNLDPRTNSVFQKKIIDAFSISSRIWKNKRECWKDHFRRGHKIFRYNELEAETLEKDLTGYHLAMNILIKTLKTDKGEYYNPECFCITPTDLFGDPLNTYSILDILQHSQIDYSYKEKKLTYDILQQEGEQYNRFRSAVFPDGKKFNRCLLSSTGCIPRDNTLPNSDRDISLIKNIVQWPNIWFDPVDDHIHRPFGIWDYNNFTYEKLRTEDLPVTDGSMRGYRMTLSWMYDDPLLCELFPLQITLYTQYDNIEGFIQYSGTPPFFDIYYGDNLLGRYGAGGGTSEVSILPLSHDMLNSPSDKRLRWNESIYPVIPGYNSNMYPAGKLSECRLRAINVIGSLDDNCRCNAFEQIWEAPEPIDFPTYPPFTQHMVSIWGYNPCTDSPVFCKYPYGAMRLYGSNNMSDWTLITGGSWRQIFTPSQTRFCGGHFQGDIVQPGPFKYFKTHVSSTGDPGSGGNIGTLLGDPMCEPAPINGQCPGPPPGCRGLWFIEKAKDFVRRPVACRCPEDDCVEFPDFGPNSCTRFTIRRCPDDPLKALIGDECVSCVGPSPQGLVYDFLR